MSRYEGKKYLAPFYKPFIVFYPLLFIMCGIAMLTDETVHTINYLYFALALLPMVALPCLLIMHAGSIYVSEKGIRFRPNTFKSVFVAWDRMVSVKPTRFLHFRNVRIITKDGGEPLQLGVDMQDMKGFIRDIAAYAPVDNPLRAYLERGEVQVSAKMPAAIKPQQSFEEKIKTDLRLDGQLRSGANWFYWIAGLSLVNTISLLIGWDWSFVAGLAITQLIDALALAFSGYFAGVAVTAVRAAAVAADVLIAGVFVVFGVFANRKRRWSFITGMSLYTVDGVLGILLQDYISAIVHAIAFFGILAGYKAITKLNGKAT